MNQCFADTGKGCSATTWRVCPDECPFFKTAQEYEEGKKKADRRVRSLPFEVREYLLERYSCKRR